MIFWGCSPYYSLVFARHAYGELQWDKTTMSPAVTPIMARTKIDSSRHAIVACFVQKSVV